MRLPKFLSVGTWMTLTLVCIKLECSLLLKNVRRRQLCVCVCVCALFVSSLERVASYPSRQNCMGMRQYSNLTMFKTICDTPTEKKQQINEQRCKFTAVQEVLCNEILISHWEAYMVRPKRGFTVKLLLFPIPVCSSIIYGTTCTNHPLQPDWRTVQSR